MPKNAKGKTRETAKGVWKWIMGDMPLTPALKQASNLPQQGIRGTRRDRALTGRPAPDIIAKSWEWIIGEQPLEPPKKQRAKRFKVPKLGKLKKFPKLPKWKRKVKPTLEPAEEEESALASSQPGSSQPGPHTDADSDFESHSDRNVDESDDELQHHQTGEPSHPPPDYTSTAPTSI